MNKTKKIELKSDLLESFQDYDELKHPDISGRPKQVKCNLSIQQKHSWFLENNKSKLLNYVSLFNVDSKLKHKALQTVLDTLLERHEPLTFNCYLEDGKVLFEKRTHAKIPVESIDFTDLNSSQQGYQVQQVVEAEESKAFDLFHQIPIRIKQLKLSSDSWLLIFCLHPIAADASSVKILMSEVGALYKAFSQSAENPLPSLSYQYSDYAHWQESDMSAELMQKLKKYWEKRLKGAPESHNLPIDRPRDEQQVSSMALFTSTLEESLSNSIERLVNSENLSHYNFLVSTFFVLLNKYSNERDLVIGTLHPGRGFSGINYSIGPFEAPLILRASIPKAISFKSLLMLNQKNISEDIKHRKYPYEELLKDIDLYEKKPINPIFQIMFSHQKNDLANFEFNQGLRSQTTVVDNNLKLDLSLKINSSAEKQSLQWFYNNKVFDESSIKQMAKSFVTLLESIVEKGLNCDIEQLSLLNNTEMSNALICGEGDILAYNQRQGLHELFEHQATLVPTEQAIVDSESSYTYEELNEQANKLARYLLSIGISSESRIGLLFERSCSYIIAILATLKAGATYVPIDPLDPEVRLKHLFKESDITVILTHKKDQESINKNVQNDKVKTFYIEDIFSNADVESLASDNLNIAICSTSPATVIFTSGSSGTPKGIISYHRGIVNRINWMNSQYPAADNEVFCQKTSINFIDHIAEIFQPLAIGKPLVIIKDEVLIDTKALIEKLHFFKVTQITLVPSLLKFIVEDKSIKKLKDLKTIFSSGEPLSLFTAKQVHDLLPNVRLVNVYGATEISADVCFHEIEHQEQLEIQEYFKRGMQDRIGIKQLEQVNDNGSKRASPRITQPYVDLESLKMDFLNVAIPQESQSTEDYLENIMNNVIPYTVNVGAEHYIGHMTSALPDFMPKLSEIVSSLNQNVVKIETSKSLTFLERQVLAMMHKLFFELPEKFYKSNMQNPDHMFGVPTSGGTTANLTAMWCARNKALLQQGITKTEISKRGSYKVLHDAGYQDAVIIGTRLLHYSFKKTASLMGIGEDNILIVGQEEDQEMSIEDLNRIVENCKKERRLIIAIVGIAGATETGVVDPLVTMAQVAKENSIHFHVDAAWGGALMFSHKHRNKLKGIEKADSITFCPHKQLYLTQGLSLCLFKNTRDLTSISTHADYQAQVGSYDIGQYTLEGSRPPLTLLLHASLYLLGQEGYEWLTDLNMTRSEFFKNLIETSDSFELVGTPTMNIINYRYIPNKYRDLDRSQLTEEQNNHISCAVETIQQQQFLKAKTFVSKTKILKSDFSLKPISVFRVVISNPLTSNLSLCEVLNDQLEIANESVEDNIYTNRFYRTTNILLSEAKQSIDEHWSVPIGKPISNTNAYVLNEYLEPVPRGVVGDLYVGGDSLSLGYIGNQRLTAEKFLPNPYSKIVGERLYATGDMALWSCSGNLKLLGRKDSQVKIRGHRIELGEIESKIYQFISCKDVTVCQYNNSNSDKTLIAYIAPKYDKDFRDNTLAFMLEKQLRETLPGYMVPSRLIFLKDFPYLKNGKLNRKKLLQKANEISVANLESPRNMTELQLINIWLDIFQVERVNIYDDFFSLGGHSLLLAKLIEKINQVLGCIISIADVQRNSKLYQLAAFIDKNNQAD